MQNPHLEEFNQFWIDNFRDEVPALPKKPSDLNITQQETMRSKAPKLYQNLFRTSLDSGKLPADLELRLRKGALWVEDEERLRRFGWEHEANTIRDARVAFEKQQLDKATAESQARVAKREQELEAYRKLDPMVKMAMHPPSAESIARARAEWNITGKADWEK
tara:strand:- start:187 stop:675 length:489 start_codon:yes stop_codon:yes gene_type:complete